MAHDMYNNEGIKRLSVSLSFAVIQPETERLISTPRPYIACNLKRRLIEIVRADGAAFPSECHTKFRRRHGDR